MNTFRHSAAMAFAISLGAVASTWASTTDNKGFDIAARSDRSDVGFGASRVELQMVLRNAAGLVDLNTASSEVLDAMLSILDLDSAESVALRDAILDWRDPDELRRLNGAEDADYAAAGLDYSAKDAPFDSIEELSRVMGMTPAKMGLSIPASWQRSRK